MPPTIERRRGGRSDESVRAAAEEPFGKMVRKIGKVMDQFQKGFFNFCSAETWQPTVNLYETEGGYLVCVDLAGVDKDKIDLTVVDNQLRLRGQRPAPVPPAEPEVQEPAARVRVHLMEIDHGPFAREVELPENVDRDKVTATYRNGMLWVELPKKNDER